LIRQGRVADGMILLDEAMVSVVADEVSPVLAGDIYCSVLEACREVFDWRRARANGRRRSPSGAAHSPTSCATAASA
jgi:hypothetical protein